MLWPIHSEPRLSLNAPPVGLTLSGAGVGDEVGEDVGEALGVVGSTDGSEGSGDADDSETLGSGDGDSDADSETLGSGDGDSDSSAVRTVVESGPAARAGAV
ncbi:hypothetical protein Acsp01_37490 [Actinoplanes sp. NBRC 101535]|nr:hypothetical protein Acsp01_37490 [Actinoplanes sp. NBRC 101535]